MQMQCDHCHGRGNVIKHSCPACQGQRIIRSTSTIAVDIDRGLEEGSEIIYEGEADESPDYQAGDLVIRVRSRKAVGGFRRKKENLYWTETISVAEALLGFERRVKGLDGHNIRLTSAPGETIQPGQVNVLHGEGLPRYHSSDFGDLFVEYNVVLPSAVKASTREKLADAFGVKVQHQEGAHQEL